ncbi:hypothetical protein, partial [Streptomyces sp. NPDC059668]|uniref:hypothetical protein n=1 Tax=Streptomyces sp. NPDC059668 TaxID=3346900 RepID=UPI0036CEAC23
QNNEEMKARLKELIKSLLNDLGNPLVSNLAAPYINSSLSEDIDVLKFLNHLEGMIDYVRYGDAEAR